MQPMGLGEGELASIAGPGEWFSDIREYCANKRTRVQISTIHVNAGWAWYPTSNSGLGT